MRKLVEIHYLPFHPKIKEAIQEAAAPVTENSSSRGIKLLLNQIAESVAFSFPVTG